MQVKTGEKYVYPIEGTDKHNDIAKHAFQAQLFKQVKCLLSPTVAKSNSLITSQALLNRAEFVNENHIKTACCILSTGEPPPHLARQVV